MRPLFQMEDALREIGETPAPAELSARVMEQIQAEAAPARRPAPYWNRAGWRNLAGLAALCGPLPGTLARGRFGEP